MRFRLLLVAAALALAAPAAAAVPHVTARAYVVEDGATGEILAARGARKRLPIASITKLMTVLLALERARPSEIVVVHPSAATIGESTLGLRAGERISVRDLVQGALIQSANDAAFALAYHVGNGDLRAFVRLMNLRAGQLGLTDTHFVRPDGLDMRGHVSSARDVTLLARIAMRNALVRDAVDERTATIAGGRRLATWNDLLGRFPGLIGVKTGHTAAAGWSQVAAAKGVGPPIYATLLGAPTRASRNTDLAELLRWGLSRYRVLTVIDGRRTYARAAVGYGRAPVALVAASSVPRAVRIDRMLVERVVAPSVVSLPVRRGERFGSVSIYAGSRLIARRPLVAARNVKEPSAAARASWYAKRTVSNLLGPFR